MSPEPSAHEVTAEERPSRGRWLLHKAAVLLCALPLAAGGFVGWAKGRYPEEPIARVPLRKQVGCPPLAGPPPSQEGRPDVVEAYRLLRLWVGYDAERALGFLYNRILPVEGRRDEAAAQHLHLTMCLDSLTGGNGYHQEQFEQNFLSQYHGSPWEAGLRADLAERPRPFPVDPEQVPPPVLPGLLDRSSRRRPAP